MAAARGWSLYKYGGRSRHRQSRTCRRWSAGLYCSSRVVCCDAVTSPDVHGGLTIVGVGLGSNYMSAFKYMERLYIVKIRIRETDNRV